MTDSICGSCKNNGSDACDLCWPLPNSHPSEYEPRKERGVVMEDKQMDCVHQHIEKYGMTEYRCKKCDMIGSGRTFSDLRMGLFVRKQKESAENLKRHMEHPFYREAAEKMERIRQGQIAKGAEKYPEPFNPDDWTDEQLEEHALMEVADLIHYIPGMGDRMRKLRALVDDLELANGILKDEAKSWQESSSEWRKEAKEWEQLFEAAQEKATIAERRVVELEQQIQNAERYRINVSVNGCLDPKETASTIQRELKKYFDELTERFNKGELR